MPRQQTVIVERQSQALPAILNVFFPPFGQLVQGRLLAFLVWLVMLVISVMLMFVFVGFIIAPIAYILCIVDAAKYRPRLERFRA